MCGHNKATESIKWPNVDFMKIAQHFYLAKQHFKTNYFWIVNSVKKKKPQKGALLTKKLKIENFERVVQRVNILLKNGSTIPLPPVKLRKNIL